MFIWLISSFFSVNYAGIFICKEVEDVHHQFVSFWSRSQAPKEEYLTALETAISKYPVIDLNALKVVKQENC